MGSILDLEAWREIFTRTAAELGASVASFLPKFLGACLILVVGYLLSRSVQAIASRGLRRLGLDGAAARLRVGELLERAEIALPASQIVAKLLFWLVMLTFVLSSVEALGLRAVTSTIDRLIAFIPGVIAAALLAIAGLFLARLAGSAVRSGAAAAGLVGAARIGLVTQALLAGMVLVVTVEQLGIATDVLVIPFAVSVGAVGFAAGLAFALGARPVVTHILAGHFLKESLPRDSAVEIAGQRGIVERVGPVSTVLRDGERVWSIPNAQLLDQVVIR